MESLKYKNRLISGLVAGLFGLIIVLLGGVWFTFSIGIIVYLGLLEFFRMTEFAGIRPATKTTVMACQILLLSTYFDSQGMLPIEVTNTILPIAGAAICGWLLLQPVTGSIADISASILGLFYLGYLPSFWIRLRNISYIDSSSFVNIRNLSELLNSGILITLISCLMIVASDIGSYYFGKILGKRPLSPISPYKTVEGAICGVICSICVGIISVLIIQCDIYGFIFGFVFGCLVGLLAIVGDLVESMMKRDAGLKDSGNALPGHGGILDRIDSYLFTPAVVYYFVTVIIPWLNN